MERVRSCDKDCVDFGTARKSFRRAESIRNFVFCGGGSGVFRITTGEGDHLAVFCQCKCRHEPFDRVEPESGNSETYFFHRNYGIPQFDKSQLREIAQVLPSSADKGLRRWPMPLMVWDEKYSVGVATMDEQHRKFFALLNRLHD